MKIKSLALGILTSTLCFSASANAFDLNPRQILSTYTLDVPHGYVNWNIGVSQLFDNKIPGTANFVNQYGPAWNVNGGYQFNSMWGLEAGYTDYYNSREIPPGGGLVIAKTEHYS